MLSVSWLEKNGFIVLIDLHYSINRAARHVDTHGRLVPAASRVCRPVVMTTLTTILGMVRLAVARGRARDVAPMGHGG